MTRQLAHRWYRCGYAACAAVLLTALGASLARAQPRAATPDSTRGASDSAATARHPAPPWFTRRDDLLLGGALAATAALAPLDRPISNEFDEPRWERSRGLHHLAKDFAFFGGDGPFVASAVLAGTAIGDLPGVRRFAIHDMEAVVLATVITGIGKGIAGRALPGVSTKHAFELGRGFHDGNGPFVAFPSGHTAAAFATATTIAAEIGRADSSRARIVSALVLSGAAAVGVARVVQRVHWPSDLPLAAVIGVWSGETVQRHSGGSGVTGAFVRGLIVGPGARGGAQVGWSSLAADVGR